MYGFSAGLSIKTGGLAMRIPLFFQCLVIEW